MTVGDELPRQLAENEPGTPATESSTWAPAEEVRDAPPETDGPEWREDSRGGRRGAVAKWGPWLTLAALAAWGLWSWRGGGVVFELLRTDLDAAAQVERLREAFVAMGWWAPAAYGGLVTLECVVAPIPGLLLYAPGGMLFGPWLGGALSLVGNVCGAGLAAAIAGRIGAERRERFLSRPAHARLRQELERRGAWWVFWLRVNPLTSSDLVSYAAGAAGLRPRNVMAATAAGMAPLCFVQSAVSHEVFRTLPSAVYLLGGLCAAYVVGAVYLVTRGKERKGECLMTKECGPNGRGRSRPVGRVGRFIRLR